MKEMKQNKNTSVVLRVSSFCIALIVLFCSIAIPSFAIDENSQFYVPGYYSGDATNYTAMYNAGTIIGGTSQTTFSYVTGSEYSEILGAWVGSSSSGKFYAISGDDLRNQGDHFVFSISKKGSTYNRVAYGSINTLDETTGLYYDSIVANISFGSENRPKYVFSTLNDALASAKTYIESASGTVAEFNYSIKPGYALFIDIHGLSDVNGTLFTNTSAAYASPHTSNQTLSYQSALPSGNVSPQGNGINWQGTGNKDLFGRYKSWNCTLIVQPNKHYIAIYNPVHINTYVDPEHEDFNGNISVHVNKAFSQTSILIPLNTELTGTGTVGTNTTESQKPVVYDENTNTWVAENEDGTPYTESPYGDYLPATTNSIHDWLQNIANLISGFFNGAIGAVTTLVGAGSAFINQLVSLYSWLPAPVYAVLSSALILVITIGVIKVFI